MAEEIVQYYIYIDTVLVLCMVKKEKTQSAHNRIKLLIFCLQSKARKEAKGERVDARMDEEVYVCCKANKHLCCC